MDQLKTSPSLADEESVCAIRTGGPQGDKAIMVLYGRYHKDIHASLKRLVSKTGRTCDYADIIHDSFVIMLHKIRDNGTYLTSVRAYWMGIARHLWLNQIKKDSKLTLVEDDDSVYGFHVDTPEQILLDEERFRRIEQCLSNCGARCHEVLIMWLSDYSMQDIADKLKLSGPAMARKIKCACFKKLKNLIVRNNIFDV